MIKITLENNDVLYLDAGEGDCLISALDWLYGEMGDLQTELYSREDILEGENFASADDEWAYIDSMGYIPINGGQWYIQPIVYSEVIEDEDDIKQAILANYLEIPFDEMQLDYDNCYNIGMQEYIVLTDDEADSWTKEYIKESIWAFNPDFLISHISAFDNTRYEDSIKAIQAIQGLYERGNDVLLALIDNINDLVWDAINTDGRGHFLSTYDGEENYMYLYSNKTEYYIYRTN